MPTRNFFTVLVLMLVCPPWAAAEAPELQEAKALNQKVIELYTEGKYDEAIPYAEKALEIRSEVLGEEHPDVATSMNNLALLHMSMSRYAEAELLYKRTLEMTTKVLGEEHPDVATSMNNLAGLRHKMGRYFEAELLYKRALKITTKALGEEHPSIAVSLHNLAATYTRTARYSDAEPIYKRALGIMTKALGEEHSYNEFQFGASKPELVILYSEPIYRMPWQNFVFCYIALIVEDFIDHDIVARRKVALH